MKDTKTVYTNRFNNEVFEHTRHMLQIEDGIKNPTDEQIYELMYFSNEVAYEIFKEEFNSFAKKCNEFVLAGKVRVWNGCFYTGFVFTDWDDLMRKCGKYDNIEVYDIKGNLFLDLRHHDGVHSFEIRELNDKGCEYHCQHEGEYELSRLYGNLMKPRYSRQLRFHKRVYES